MGVPGFYRTIFKRYRNDNIYKFISANPNIDYFYLDFNPIIYISLGVLQREGELDNCSDNQLEDKLIVCVIDSACFIVNELVKPKKMTYIAIDGPAPKCKVVTQRARRYKGIIENQIKTEIQKKYLQKKIPLSWDKASITPGTKFMEKLDKALHTAMSKGMFKCPKVIFNNSAVASEGEHKITQHLSRLEHSPDETICIYSNDGDMAFLTLQFPEKQILTMIDSNFLPKNLKKECESDYVYFVNNIFHKVLIEDMFFPKEYRTEETKEKESDLNSNEDDEDDGKPTPMKISTSGEDDNEENGEDGEAEVVTEPPKKKRKMPPPMNPDDYDQNRILLDFMFLIFLGGNDFVRPIPFAKIRTTGTFTMFLKTYMHSLKKTGRFDEYLLNKDRSVNRRFLSNVMYGLSIQEARRMSYYQNHINESLKKEPEWGPFETWEEEWLQYQHTPYHVPGHPKHDEVKEKLLEFDYSDVKKHNLWKDQYYQKNFGLNPQDENYNMEKLKICRTYVKSLLFTLQYYLNGIPPSWRWNYPYEVAPWPSDIVISLRTTDLNRLAYFHPDTEPYSSQEQLLLTVPITSKVFPEEYKVLQQYLPNFLEDLDRVNGEKYIYSEPVLEPINEYVLLDEARKIRLNPDTYNRNKKTDKIYVFE